jgi:acyl-CoA dehydrogenase
VDDDGDDRIRAEQELLRASVRKFLSEAAPETELPAMLSAGGGFDPGVWPRMADQLGLPGLAVPAEYGGGGGDFLDLEIVLEEMGRALFCGPFLSSAVLATQMLLLAGDTAACADYLPGISAGELTAAVCRAPRGASPTVAAARGAGRHELTGGARGVLAAGPADVLLVEADADGRPSLFAVPGTAGGVECSAIATLDLTRRQASVRFTSAPGRLLAEPGDAVRVGLRLDAIGAWAIAAEQVGGATRVLELAVEHARTRQQFGRAIGSFQAIKHMCADVLVAVEAATATAADASRALRDASEAAPLAVSVAKVFCSEAYLTAAKANVQVHGGMGFTWDGVHHLHLKRAVASAAMFGTPRQHRENITALLEAADRN